MVICVAFIPDQHFRVIIYLLGLPFMFPLFTNTIVVNGCTLSMIFGQSGLFMSGCILLIKLNNSPLILY